MVGKRPTSGWNDSLGEQQVVDHRETETGVREPVNSEAREALERVEAQQAMLRIANPQDRNRYSWRRGRARFLDRFRWLKLCFMLKQRYLPLRAINSLLFLLERKRISRVHYLPPVVSVEAVGGCNLRCPECATGAASPLGRKKGKATLSYMKSVIDQICRRSLQISFHGSGEPLLNDDFYAACAYAEEKGLWTVIHSNLNIRTEGLAQKIVSSRLCNLVISCDGATQAVYEKYRVGGDVELVFRNLQEIVREKQKTGSSFPWITAQFLVFEHNWQEMGLFRERALAAGADELLFLPGCRNGAFQAGRAGADQVFSLAELDWVQRESPPICWDLWDSLLLTYDGGAYPCCFGFRDADLFVAPQEADQRVIRRYWNCPEFRTARRFFCGRPVPRNELPQPCRSCARTGARGNRPKVRDSD
jgi:pyruvate-formate lyase-activating enzyme